MVQIADIKSRVRCIMDYNQQSSELDNLEDISTLDLDTMIEESIVPGMTQVCLLAPVEKLKIARYEEETGTLTDYVTLAVPGDYLRFVSCQCVNWHYPVTELHDVGSKEHRRQFSEFEGLKATADNPVAVLCMADSTTMLLQMFGGKPTGKRWLDYIARPKVTEEGIDIPEAVEDAAYYTIAAFVCEMLKDTQKSQQMIQTAQSLLMTSEDIQNKTSNAQQI